MMRYGGKKQRNCPGTQKGLWRQKNIQVRDKDCFPTSSFDEIIHLKQDWLGLQALEDFWPRGFDTLTCGHVYYLKRMRLNDIYNLACNFSHL